MKKLHVLLRLALAFRVALFLAGASLGPMCWADSITIPTGPFCSDCVVTNLVFYDVDEVDEWIDALRDELDSVSNQLSHVDSNIGYIRSYCGTITNACNGILDSLSAYSWPVDSMGHIRDVESYVSQIENAVNNEWSSVASILGRCNTLDNQLYGVKNSVRGMYVELDDTVPEYRAQFATMCEASGSSGGSGSCSCSCPDYTSFIDDIEDQLDDIYGSLSSVSSTLAFCLQRLVNINGQVLTIVDNTDLIREYDENYKLPFLVGIGAPYGIVDYGTGETEQIGIEVGRALILQSVLQDMQTNVISRFALRDWWNWSGGLHNSPDLQDFVDFVSVGLQGVAGLVMPYDDASAWPIVNAWRDYYYNRNVHPTNEVSNPLWVAFTNSVKLDPALLDSNRLKISVEAYSSSSLDSLANMLTNLVLSVTMVTNNVTVDVQNEFDTSVDILDEEMGEMSDADQDSIQMPTANVSFSGIGSVVSRVINSYSSMFSVIPDEPPSDIVVYKGHSYHLPGQSEDFEVESIHWSPFASSRDGESPESYVLNSIRLCFRFAWTVLYVILIYAATAVDLAVVGICAYAVWGVLLGRTDAMVKGFFYCFNVVRRLLGV